MPSLSFALEGLDTASKPCICWMSILMEMAKVRLLQYNNAREYNRAPLQLLAAAVARKMMMEYKQEQLEWSNHHLVVMISYGWRMWWYRSGKRGRLRRCGKDTGILHHVTVTSFGRGVVLIAILQGNGNDIPIGQINRRQLGCLHHDMMGSLACGKVLLHFHIGCHFSQIGRGHILAKLLVIVRIFLLVHTT
jgi:hypothetical protein